MAVVDGIAVTYNGYDLQTGNIITKSVSHRDIPTKAISSFALARANRTVKTASFFTQKTITLKGQIAGNSLADLDNRIDAFKGAVETINDSGNLDIGYNSGTRRYVATISGLAIDETDSPLMNEFDLQLLCLSPWGINTSANTLIASDAITTASNNHPITLLGNAREQVCKLTYTLTSFTGASSNTVYFDNINTGQTLSIAGARTAGDVIVIDNDAMTVKINGTDADFDGVFSSFAPGSGSYTVRDDFTARAATLNITQVPRWQ